MTTRERRERRAERLREWASKRGQKAAQAGAQARALGSAIPMGQPILVGHHSERGHRRHLSRIDAAMSRAVEHGEKARSMASRAANIEAALDRSIYSDDEDAVQRLRERIAGLEAERDRIKAFNASARRGQPDESLLDERQRAALDSVRRHTPYALSKGGGFPAYALSNLSGNIKRNRDRLNALQETT